MGSRGLDQGVGGALKGQGETATVGLRLANLRDRLEFLGRGLSDELDLQVLDGDRAQVLQRVDDDESPLAQHRDPVGHPLDLRERVRGEKDRSTFFAHLSNLEAGA